MGWFSSIINHTPGFGTLKGLGQVIIGDTKEGVQTMKDSVKIPAIVTYVTFSSIGGGMMSEDDGPTSEDRCDAAEGTVQMVQNIWNWGKKTDEKQDEPENK